MKTKQTEIKPNLDTPKGRVEAELEELSLKTGKLGEFMGKEAFNALPTVQKVLLDTQYYTMRTYMNILETRLAYWDDETAAQQ